MAMIRHATADVPIAAGACLIIVFFLCNKRRDSLTLRHMGNVSQTWQCSPSTCFIPAAAVARQLSFTTIQAMYGSLRARISMIKPIRMNEMRG